MSYINKHKKTQNDEKKKEVYWLVTLGPKKQHVASWF